MNILSREELIQSINSEDTETIFLDPLLDERQIGEMSIDLRLGYDFQVSILTRKPYIEIGKREGHFSRGVRSYFQRTRRDIGDRFVLYPNQVVLATTIEYLSLPSDTYVDLLSRSSYTRLGMHIATMVQPGFRGCVPLELFNHSNNAVELIVGSRICQARFFKTDHRQQYKGVPRKYFGNVRPVTSKADNDYDIDKLSKLRSSN
ncbi:dCTP deaminase [uncultured Methylophaga sp.]|uniref:dCTP deaminase n=1 Tax=uncultured Methylophaga sp. TaxID=285271 RepID=UPI0030FB55CF